MTASTLAVLEHVAALGAWEGVDVARMPVDDALLAVETGAKALAALQGFVSRFAARVDMVCEQSPGMNGYARRHGYASGSALLAAATGLAPGEVNRLASLGRGLLEADAGAALAQREALALVEYDLEPTVAAPGEPPHRAASNIEAHRELAPGEYLSRAVDAGRIGTAHGEVIRATLADFTIDSREAEREFVDYALNAGLRKLKQHCFWRLGELDPAGLAAREKRQVQERFVAITDGPDGMVNIVGKLPVAWAAPVKTLLDTMTSSALRRQRTLPAAERLHAGQLCADALADVALHALSCESVPRRPKTTVVVRIDHGALVNDLHDAGLVHVGPGGADPKGGGTSASSPLGTCDGILQPITAGTARLMAVEAQILPAVMGGESLPLDLGRARRLFTKPQALAVVERDRGCVRCSAPPAFCHQHHIVFWSDDGPSDLSNAVTLCTSCHHRLHEQRWRLELVGDHIVVMESEGGREPGRRHERQTGRSERHPNRRVA